MSETFAVAVIIGGGFYGAAIAIYLAKQRGLKRVVLHKREPKLLGRAPYHAEARVHDDCYPRRFTTAFRRGFNQPRFACDWPDAVKQDFTKPYAVARRNSEVTAKQVERVCHAVDAKIQPAQTGPKKLFEPKLIASAFLVEEYAFDSTRLAAWAQKELKESHVEMRRSQVGHTALLNQSAMLVC